MDVGTSVQRMSGREGTLYPLLVIAAISVILFSALGVATLTGWLPRAESVGDPQHGTPSANVAQPASSALTGLARSALAACTDCGVVEAIHAVDVNGQSTGLGVAAGAIAGAVLGNQIGRGGGRAVATIAGAAGGAYAGNEIEKNMKKAVRYRVRVRMDDGTQRTAYQSQPPAVGVGEKVRIVNGQVVAAG